MSFSYKKWIGLSIVFIITLIVVVSSQARVTEAQSAPAASAACPAGNQLYGWAWSSTVGWFSFNSHDPGAGGGPHCVSIDGSGNLTGYAWSSNVGWVKFGGLSSFPAGGATTAVNARLATSSGQQVIEGWARACAGTSTGDCLTMTSRTDGWDGWIELSTAGHPITYSGNTVSGFAWGADVIGWLQMNLSTTQTVSVGAPACQLTNAQSLTDATKWKLTWTSSNSNYCSGNFSVNSTSGSTEVSPSDTTVYNMTCKPIQSGQSDAFCSTTVTVVGGSTNGPGGGCHEGDPGCTVQPPCPDCTTAGPIQMWLNNDTQEQLSYMKVRAGKNVNINWRPTDSTTYSQCALSFAPAEGGLPTLTFDNSANHSNGNPYVKSDLPVGTYNLTISCQPTDVNQSSVPAKTKASASSLQIKITDPNESEI